MASPWVRPGQKLSLDFVTKLTESDNEQVGAHVWLRNPETGEIIHKLVEDSVPSAEDRTNQAVHGREFGNNWEIFDAHVATSHGSSHRTAIYARLSVIPAGPVLAQGFVRATEPLPMGRFEHPTDTDGHPVHVSEDPAAGNEPSAQTVPTNTWWKLRGFNMSLSTDATAATRDLVIQFRDENDTVMFATSFGGTVGASSSATYDAAIMGETDDNFERTLPEVVLPEGWDVHAEINNFQNGDDVQVEWVFEEWLAQ